MGLFNKKRGSVPSSKFYRKQRSFFLSNVDTIREITSSELWSEYINLSENISDLRSRRKSYRNKHDWLNSADYLAVNRYEQLRKDRNIRFIYRNSLPLVINQFAKWELMFEERFEKVLNNSIWELGHAVGNGHTVNYTSPDDLSGYQSYNARIKSKGGLQITTIKEDNQNREWNAIRGFFERDFEYSSAILNSGKSLVIEEGKIDFEFSARGNKHVQHAIWLLSNDRQKQINVCRFNKRITTIGFSEKADNSQPEEIRETLPKVKPHRRRYIFSIEKNIHNIKWLINGKEVYSLEGHFDFPVSINIASLVKQSNNKIASNKARFIIKNIVFYRKQQN